MMGKKKSGLLAGAILTAGITGILFISSYFPWKLTFPDYLTLWREQPLLMALINAGSIIFWGYIITSGCKELYVPGRD